jgi:hypothetical protein
MTSMSWRVFLIALQIAFLSLLAFPPAAPGQDAQWFQHNDKGDRYEGLIDQPNAKREYTVLAFFAFHENLPRDLKGNLHVKYFVPDKEPVFIQARQNTRRTNYLMVSKGAPSLPGQWNHFQWPAGEVLGRPNLDHSDLGVVVRLKSDNEYTEDLAPAVFYNQAEPRTLSRQYELILKLQRYSITRLKYTITAAGSPPVTCFYVKNSCSREPAGSEGFIEVGNVVSLPIDLRSVTKAADVNIQIEGEYKDRDDSLHAAYRFHHQPDYQ